MANVIIGMGFFAAAMIFIVLANFEFMELTFEIDQHLPVGQKLNDSIWWTAGKHLRVWRLQKQHLPDSQRARNVKILSAVGLGLFLVAMFVLTAKPF